MGFQEESGSLFSRLHLSAVPRPAAVGTALLAVVLAAAMAGGLLPLLAGGGFTVKAAEEAADGTGGEAPGQAAAAGEGAGSEGDGEGVAAPSVEGAGGAQPPAGAAEGAAASPSGQVPAAAARICVHVDGAVRAPGVYALDAGARVADAVQAAGGLAGDASSTAVNLAQVLEDGQQIVVPTEAEVAEGAAVGVAGGDGGAGSSGGGAGGTGGSANAGSSAASSGGGMAAAKVNINTASAAELITLSGIGEATAAKIIAYREANGRFAAIEDIKLVSGIGEKKFEALRDAICV